MGDERTKENRDGFYIHIGIAHDRSRTWGPIHTIIWGKGGTRMKLMISMHASGKSRKYCGTTGQKT
jgi:hypothetical protein